MRKSSILEFIQSAFSSLIEFCKFEKGDEIKPHKGYYSIVQYCPDLSRFEAANIGVLLFCPDGGFLKVMTSGNNGRIIRFFGSEGHGWKRINTIKKALQDRLDKEHKGIRTVEDLQQFIATQNSPFVQPADLQLKAGPFTNTRTKTWEISSWLSWGSSDQKMMSHQHLFAESSTKAMSSFTLPKRFRN